MKKPNDIEKKIDIIRKTLQKEREILSVKESVEKTNKNARELAKKFGFKFLTDINKSESPISQNDLSSGMITEETTEYNVKEKDD